MGVDRLNLTVQVQSFGLNSLPSQLPHYKTNKNSEYRSFIPNFHTGADPKQVGNPYIWYLVNDGSGIRCLFDPGSEIRNSFLSASRIPNLYFL